jgi:flagellar protein FlbD
MVFLEIVNGSCVYLNEHYIESVEGHPDTTVRIHGGTVYVVKQRPEQIVRQIVEWHRTLQGCRSSPPGTTPQTGDLAQADAFPTRQG